MINRWDRVNQINSIGVWTLDLAHYCAIKLKEAKYSAKCQKFWIGAKIFDLSMRLHKQEISCNHMKVSFTILFSTMIFQIVKSFKLSKLPLSLVTINCIPIQIPKNTELTEYQISNLPYQISTNYHCYKIINTIYSWSKKMSNISKLVYGMINSIIIKKNTDIFF